MYCCFVVSIIFFLNFYILAQAYIWVNNLSIKQIPISRTDKGRTSIHLSVCCAICDFAQHQSLPCVKGGGTAKP